MNVIAVNGSPRKRGNTAVLLECALEGAAAAAPSGRSAASKLVHLYDLRYSGCRSCFACKRLGGPSYGQCAIKDDLASLLEEIAHADALILGSPIYFGDISGQMRCFLERLCFPWMVYDGNHSSIAPRRMETAVLYTMNVTEAQMEEWGYGKMMETLESFLGHLFTPPRRLCVTDTYQFSDYSKYKCDCFDEAAKRRRRDEHFPLDCEAARRLGARLTAGSAS